MSPNSRSAAPLSPSIDSHASKIDRFFVGLFLAQWAAGIGLAYVRPSHDDALFVAIFLGAVIASVPTLLVVWKPGAGPTRHAMAVAQVLFGALLVHLTRGAHQTRAHVFFSLAILALYRDPKVVVSAAVVGAAQAFAVGSRATAVELTMWIALATPALFVLARRLEAPPVVEGKVEVEVEASKVDVASPPVVADDDEEPDSTQLLCLIPSKPPSSRRIDCSILLVEDDVASQKIFVEHLERAGVSVAIAQNGEAALSEVSAASQRGKPFDLVLMDMHMPVMNGYEATAELRRRGYEAPIIAMKGDERRSLDAGCTEYLTKATSREHLIQVVANHGLGSAATMPPPARKANDDAISSDHADSQEMQELLEAFVARLHQNAEEIEAAEAGGQASELELIAHRLRGAAPSFGFMAIGEAAGALEDALHAGRGTKEPAARLVALCRRAQTRGFLRAA